MKQLLIWMIFIILLMCSCTKNNDEYKVEVNKDKVDNIILLIGDGMGLSHITASLVANGNYLNLERFPIVGLQKTFGADQLVTGSGAAMTAIISGSKANYGTFGLNAELVPLKTIFDYIAAKKKSRGLITTTHITDATMAAFYAHSDDRYDFEGTALQLVSSNIDVFFGGGRDHFNQRTDGLNLIDSLINNNYTVLNSIDEVNNTLSSKLAVLYHENKPPGILEGRGDVLSKATKISLEILNKNKNGFFLCIEGGQIDWKSHENNLEALMAEMNDFDKAVGLALNFAIQNENTLVILTSDHECGGFSLLNGNLNNHSVEGSFATDAHTAALVTVFAFGPQSQLFSGIYDNTNIFYKMMSALKISPDK